MMILEVKHPGNRQITYDNVDSFQFRDDRLYVSGHDWNKWEDKWHVINEEPIESISCYYEHWEVGT